MSKQQTYPPSMDRSITMTLSGLTWIVVAIFLDEHGDSTSWTVFWLTTCALITIALYHLIKRKLQK